jgi:hypothetical protein
MRKQKSYRGAEGIGQSCQSYIPEDVGDGAALIAALIAVRHESILCTVQYISVIRFGDVSELFTEVGVLGSYTCNGSELLGCDSYATFSKATCSYAALAEAGCSSHFQRLDILIKRAPTGSSMVLTILCSTAPLFPSFCFC